MTNAAQKTPISLLQELCATNGMNPDYQLMSVEGAVHAPTFMYRVRVNEIVATATGQSKKKAKHAAAKAVLEQLLSVEGGFEKGFVSDGVTVNAETLNEVISEAIVTPTVDENCSINPVGQLQELCMKRRWQPPYYETEKATGLPHEKVFSIMCMVDNFTTSGEGKSKRLAKRQAAENMLNRLKVLKIISEDEEEAVKGSKQEEEDVSNCSSALCDRDSESVDLETACKNHSLSDGSCTKEISIDTENLEHPYSTTDAKEISIDTENLEHPHGTTDTEEIIIDTEYLKHLHITTDAKEIFMDTRNLEHLHGTTDTEEIIIDTEYLKHLHITTDTKEISIDTENLEHPHGTTDAKEISIGTEYLDLLRITTDAKEIFDTKNFEHSHGTTDTEEIIIDTEYLKHLHITTDAKEIFMDTKNLEHPHGTTDAKEMFPIEIPNDAETSEHPDLTTNAKEISSGADSSELTKEISSDTKTLEHPISTGEVRNVELDNV